MTTPTNTMTMYDSFGWSAERRAFAAAWRENTDRQYWERKLGYICSASELITEDMVGYYHTSRKPRLLLDTKKREVVKGSNLPESIKYLAISHGWNESLVKGVVLHGMFWDQDYIDEAALECIIKDARSLGFRYVWIDALCTPQNDDFAIENFDEMRDNFSECASCLVYLNGVGVDVTTEDVENGHLQWFSRYWTLQEGWLPYQCLYKLSRNNETVYATDFNFYWLIAASPQLGENKTLQRAYELLGVGWYPTLANIDRQLAGRDGYNSFDMIHSILQLIRPYFKDPDTLAPPRETDVVKLTQWFVDQLKDPSQLVSCPTILSLFRGSTEYAWLRNAPMPPMSVAEKENIEYDVVWPTDPSEPLGIGQSREYPSYPLATRNVMDLWDYRVARSIQRAMPRRSGGSNNPNDVLREKLTKYMNADGPSGHIVENILNGYKPERLALVSTHKRWPDDPMIVARELILVKSSDISETHIYHCVGWRESLLESESFPDYRKQLIWVAESEDIPLR
ncbi:hypothetical protein BJ742DRAFT_867203 [Cladochytrium replicatum]|nr:hypothetical protein BJ742DRAFT_867203 [Cladochytrium replicatum]